MIVPSLIKLYAFPAVDITDMIDSDLENSIFLSWCFTPLIPQELRTFVFLLKIDSSTFNMYFKWLNHFEILTNDRNFWYFNISKLHFEILEGIPFQFCLLFAFSFFRIIWRGISIFSSYLSILWIFFDVNGLPL